ncbi:hypothetical protein Q4544_13790 [Cognatishimia sp. 1_MG-2023]|uniref:hypothetical protein n=1 Tax=Cognatishimia sp. 1_MG-2023 TaxID=3062642 RepID=UPI0026E399BE|nr:hypothetical protein [Cognatishimia sp. 1_MG-2023]MDO6728009.1 hypothetical protein [Cognatishimia sp. 1_MG-2023]
MFSFRKKNEFEMALRSSLPTGFTLEAQLWRYIQWLESQKQTFKYRNTQDLFVPTTPVANFNALWSHLAFVVEPDLVRHWFGKKGLENVIVPIVKCGADGSYFAVWKNDRKDRYVFLGSEGEAFQVADDVRHFIVLLTMGYFSIEGRDTVSLTPKEDFSGYNSQPWPKPILAQEWVSKNLEISYPVTAAEILDFDNDPFPEFVDQQVA